MKNSIVIKIGAAIGAIVTFLLFATGYLNYKDIKTSKEREIKVRTQNAFKRLKHNLPKALWDFDKEAEDILLDSEMSEPSIRAIIVEVPPDVSGRWRNNGGNISKTGDLSVPSVYSISSKLIWGNDSTNVVGILTVHIDDRAVINSALKSKIFEIILQALLLNIAVSALLFYILRSHLLKPLKQVVCAAKAISIGDLRQEISITNQKDEIGQLLKAFAKMTKVLKDNVIVAEKIALGDLSTKVVVHSEWDNLGKAMALMKDNLRDLDNRLQITLEHQKLGELDARCETGDLKGSYLDLLNNMNHALDAVIQPILTAIDLMQEYAKENLEKEMKTLPGKQIVITDAMNFLRHEIEARIRSQEELIIAQKAIVEKAHKAGMADVATGVIHNLGNILNSVYTSSKFITTITSNSSLGKLEKANELLRDNIEDPVAFFTEDARGPKLLQYYLKMENSFKEEQSQLTEHALRVIEKLNAMNDVINVQQNYAKASFYSEDLDIPSIIDETLKLQESSFEKHDIKLIREYDDVSKIEVQKTKLAQIFLNLLKNAKESVKDNQQGDKNIRIKVEQDTQNLYVRVIDNGIGISVENKSKIFNHGFTTKESGHGFGLHSCANYMTEMGAKIKAESDGVGTGATFLLTFPRISKN